MATATAKTETKTVNEWDILEPVAIPRAHQGEEKNLFVCVNGRTFNIPKNGRTVNLPKPVAEVVREHLDALIDEQDVLEHIPNKG